MTKLKDELALPGDEAVVLDRPFLIVLVEIFKSDLRGYQGVRVTLNGGEGLTLAIPLWSGDVVSRNSKLGSFMALLGDETDDWIGKTIIFKTWSDKSRQIEIVPTMFDAEVERKEEE